MPCAGAESVSAHGFSFEGKWSFGSPTSQFALAGPRSAGYAFRRVLGGQFVYTFRIPVTR